VRLVDSHLHLDSPDLREVLAVASATGTLLLACGTDERTSALVLREEESNPANVRAFVGVHPSEVSTGMSLAWLARCLERASGLGEVGLDPKYSPVGPGTAQTAVFLAQLEVAQAQGKPIQVHSRNAEEECLEHLGSHSFRSVLMHWFQDEEMLPEVLGRGYYVSFGPSLLYSRKAQRIAARCGPELSLTETDSPVPYGPLGGVHGPALTASVVFKLADVWRLSYEDARLAVAANAARYLGRPEKG